MKRAVKTYSQFVNEGFFGNMSKRRELMRAAREWVATKDEEERRAIRARLEEEGHDMDQFTRAIGDAYEEQW
jgi:hypothetical protein